MLVDRIVIRVRSGSGGRGCESFNRRNDKKVIPNGGDGGGGGDVIFRADKNISNLKMYQPKRLYEATRGDLGSSNEKTGKKGSELVLKVPCGTTIYNSENNFIIRDLVEENDSVVICKGGKGGVGNTHRSFSSQPKEGEEITVTLDYSIVGDVFLVGTPNSGKSSLLRSLTGCNVNIEDYPFSTRDPQFGTYENDRFQQFSVCELPSIEKGSSEKKGLGNRFLKHLKRAKLLFILLDPISNFAKDISDAKRVIEEEINQFNPEYNQIPKCYIINKIDVEGLSLNEKDKLFGPQTFYVSAKTGAGIEDLKKKIDLSLGEK